MIRYIVGVVVYTVDNIQLLFKMRHVNKHYHALWVTMLNKYYTPELRQSDLAVISEYKMDSNVFIHITANDAVIFARPPLVTMKTTKKTIIGGMEVGVNHKYVSYKALLYAFAAGLIDEPHM